MKLTKIHDLSFEQLKNRLQSVVYKLAQLTSRVTEKTELAIFLTAICTNFKFEVKNNWNDLDVITIDDELEALTETEQGELCRQSYLRLKKKGMDVDLRMIMRGLMAPAEMHRAITRASSKKKELARSHQAKVEFLASQMGRGIMLLSMSMIKYSWYSVMKANYERGLQIKQASQNVLLLTQASSILKQKVKMRRESRYDDGSTIED